MSKLLFLGTGGDDIVVGQQMKSSGGMILQINETVFHINPGPGSLVKAKQYGYNLRYNTAILASDNNINNVNDINAVISSMTHAGLDPKGVLVGNKNLVENETSFLRPGFAAMLEKVISIDGGSKVGINDVEVKAIATKNKFNAGSLGFKLKSSVLSVTYTGVTNFDEELINEYLDSDILIIDTKYPFNMEGVNGLNSNQIVSILQKVKPNVAVLTGFGVKFLNDDPLHQGREIQKLSGVHTIIAKDGFVLDTKNYSSVNVKNYNPIKGY